MDSLYGWNSHNVSLGLGTFYDMGIDLTAVFNPYCYVDLFTKG